MLEERVGKIEEHMVQLIQMIAKTNNTVMTLSKEFNEERILNEERHRQLRDEFQAERKLNEERHQQLRQEFKEDRKLNEQRHKELLFEIRDNKADINY